MTNMVLGWHTFKIWI